MTTVPNFQSRSHANEQLSHRIKDPGIRAWLLLNVGQNPNTGDVGWTNNLDVIHNSFRKGNDQQDEVILLFSVILYCNCIM